jgi:hypothetical protein
MTLAPSSEDTVFDSRGTLDAGGGCAPPANPERAAADTAPPDDEEDGPVYTVTEAARLARVSVQALRQRISRGTLSTTRMVRDRRVVAGVPRGELARAYPELADAADADLDRILHGEPTGGPPAATQQEAATGAKHDEKTLELIVRLRRKLVKERDARARLEGVVEDQERRLEELQIERMRLERRVTELDQRLIFLDGFEDDAPRLPSWWRRGVVWARIAVAVVVLSTFFAAGGAYWQQLDARFQALATSLGGESGLADASSTGTSSALESAGSSRTPARADG